MSVTAFAFCGQIVILVALLGSSDVEIYRIWSHVIIRSRITYVPYPRVPLY